MAVGGCGWLPQLATKAPERKGSSRARPPKRHIQGTNLEELVYFATCNPLSGEGYILYCPKCSILLDTNKRTRGASRFTCVLNFLWFTCVLTSCARQYGCQSLCSCLHSCAHLRIIRSSTSRASRTDGGSASSFEKNKSRW